MSLYGRTDSNANKTKAGVGIAATSQSKTTLYIDETEAALEANKERGLNAPGWWSYFTYTDHSGATRHKAEQLIFVAGGDTNANETQADDTIAADAASAVTISAQPANSTSSSGAGTFTLTTATTGTPGALAYQWQRQTVSGKRWVNIAADTDTGITYADFTTATLAYSGLAGTTLNGYKYRCVLNTSKGAETKYTDGAATLTFGS